MRICVQWGAFPVQQTILLSSLSSCHRCSICMTFGPHKVRIWTEQLIEAKQIDNMQYNFVPMIIVLEYIFCLNLFLLLWTEWIPHEEEEETEGELRLKSILALLWMAVTLSIYKHTHFYFRFNTLFVCFYLLSYEISFIWFCVKIFVYTWIAQGMTRHLMW